jgi:hypothetical protein
MLDAMNVLISMKDIKLVSVIRDIIFLPGKWEDEA